MRQRPRHTILALSSMLWLAVPTQPEGMNRCACEYRREDKRGRVDEIESDERPRYPFEPLLRKHGKEEEQEVDARQADDGAIREFDDPVPDPEFGDFVKGDFPDIFA